MPIEDAICESPHRLPREAYIGLVRASFVLCATQHHPIFNTTKTRDLVVKILSAKSVRYQCAVTVYVVMPNHVHVILRGENIDSDLYEFVVQVKRAVTYALGHKPWQKGFFDHVIRDRLDLARHIMYVLFNPVRAGLAMEWWQYPGSGSLTGSLDEIMQFARDMKQMVERDGKKW